MRSRLIVSVLGAIAVTAVSAATAAEPSHHRSTASVVPNGTSCPSSNTQATIPPVGRGAVLPDTAHDSAQAGAPNIVGSATCPPTASDAQTNIARGNALAKPEPLNSPTLITPRR